MIQGCRTVIRLAVFFSLLLHSTPWAQQPSGGTEQQEFSPQERKWAVQWINNRIALLMEDGFITRIKCSENESSYEVFVSSDWDFLTVEDKRAFLADFSRARRITGHSPFLLVKRNDSAEVVGQVSGRGIFLFGQGEEYFSPSEG